jgi:hypothetical protein
MMADVKHGAPASAVENDQDDGRAARWSIESKKSKVMVAITRLPQSSNSAGPVQQPVTGPAISDRDRRWLAEQLPSSYQGEPDPFWFELEGRRIGE